MTGCPCCIIAEERASVFQKPLLYSHQDIVSLEGEPEPGLENARLSIFPGLMNVGEHDKSIDAHRKRRVAQRLLRFRVGVKGGCR